MIHRPFAKNKSEKKPRGGHAESYVQPLLKALKFDPSLYALFSVWDSEAQLVVRGCRAVGLQGTKLHAVIPSAAHRQEILFYKNRLIQKVNQALGRRAITDVHFELGFLKDE